jgi:hypothetical protein
MKASLQPHLEMVHLALALKLNLNLNIKLPYMDSEEEEEDLISHNQRGHLSSGEVQVLDLGFHLVATVTVQFLCQLLIFLQDLLRQHQVQCPRQPKP